MWKESNMQVRKSKERNGKEKSGKIGWGGKTGKEAKEEEMHLTQNRKEIKETEMGNTGERKEKGNTEEAEW